MTDKLDRIIAFLNTAGKLKSTFRFSEVQNMPKGLKDSSAAHSWRLALMVSVLIDELNLNVNKERALELAIAHDIAESVTGDIDATLIFNGKVSREEKHKQEKEAIEGIKKSLPPKAGSKILNLWHEYEQGSTKEAKLVKALDKLETLVHLADAGYQSWDEPQFMVKYADEAVRNFPELKELLKTIKQKLRSEFDKGNIPWKEEYDT